MYALRRTLPILRVIEGVRSTKQREPAYQRLGSVEGRRLKREEFRNGTPQGLSSHMLPEPKEGTQRVELGGGYNLKAVHKINTKISASNEAVDKAEDEASKCGNEGTFLFERIITWTPNFSKSEYKKLEATTRRISRSRSWLTV
jgi:hypothetical protein